MWRDVAWAEVVRLGNEPPLAVLREGAAYLGPIAEREPDWRDVDFVGAVSWKADLKIGLTPRAVEDACERLGESADVVALYPFAADLMAHTTACLPRFPEAWVGCLGAMGYSASDATSPALPYFVCNYWLARPAWMASYLCWLARLWRVMREEPGVQDALWAPAPYPTALPRERLEAMYGVPHLPHHSFLVERAPCFYFWKHGARIAYP